MTPDDAKKVLAALVESLEVLKIEDLDDLIVIQETAIEIMKREVAQATHDANQY